MIISDELKMHLTPGMSRRVLIVFTAGIALGFCVTYLLFTSTTQNQHALGHRRLVPHEHFIPLSPHSHGETDDFVGPEHAQLWSDSHHHHGKYDTYLGCHRRFIYIETHPLVHNENFS